MSEFLKTVFGKFELLVHKGYYYIEDGFWASVEGDRIRIGMTDFLQRTVGDAAFIEFSKKGSIAQRRAEVGVLETAKASVSIISPVSGTVEETNTVLDDRPELVNSDPYGEGWLLILTPDHLDDDLKSLMSADDYFTLMIKKLESDRVGA